MIIQPFSFHCGWAASITIAVLLFASPVVAGADDFERTLARVDRALETNPHRVVGHALDTCSKRRRVAAQLYHRGHNVRAERSLKYCVKLLKLPDEKPKPKSDRSKQRAEARADMRAKAVRELDRALTLTPDIENGFEIYRGCAACHTPEGWGLTSGVVPQLSGQHRKVIIKQLADIRSGHRANRLMIPYASVEAIGGSALSACANKQRGGWHGCGRTWSPTRD